MNRQDLDYQQDNEQQSGNEKWLERFYEILNKSDKYEFVLHSDKEFFANELFDIAKEYAATQNNKTEDKWIDINKDSPDYDEPVLWLTEEGNMFVDSLDKDGNEWLDSGIVDGFKMPKVTHWHSLPPTPTK